MKLLDLPQELLVLIFGFLRLRDYVKVRRTCKLLSHITYERELWVKVLQEQMRYLPLPRHFLLYRGSDLEDTHLLAHSDSEIESVAIEAEIVSELWSRLRPQPPYKLNREKIGNTLMGMKLFLDRWLMVVYFEGAAYLYDTQPEDQSASNPISERQYDTTNSIARTPVLRAALYLESGLWITHVTAVDQKGEILYLALSRSAPPHMVQIYEINLKSLSANSHFVPNAFFLLKSIALPLYKVIRAIEPEQRLIALSTSGLVEVIDMDGCHADPEDNPSTQTIRVNTDDQEGLWNGVIAVQFLGAYMLVFRTRSVEAHKYVPGYHSLSGGAETSALKHNFSMTFREVSFAQTKTTRHPITDAQTFETSLFAYDVIQGLFHYVVRIVSPSPTGNLHPFIEVVLKSVYPLAVGLNHSNLYIHLPLEPTPNGGDTPTAISYSANFTPSPSPTPISSHGPGYASYASSARLRDQLDGGARGFLSTHAIGGQGRRGIWVERKRSSTLREIQVWSQSAPSLLSTDGSEDVTAVEIPRRVVYSLKSFDLRDDITCCTFGELSGLIVLGHRSGDVSLLELNGDDP